MARRFLVLGGAGYVGARLSELLLGLGDVVVTARKLTPAKRAWAESRGEGLALQAFDSKVTDKATLKGPFDCVLNLATPGAAENGKDAAGSLAGALASLDTGLGLLKSGQAKRLVHFSSFHVYGRPGDTSYRETDTPSPTHPYGQAHLACEERARPYFKSHSVVVLRPTNIVGAPAHADLGPQEKLFFLDCCRQAAADRAIRLNNDGKAQRDFVPFADVLSAVERVSLTDSVASGIYNLALGHSQTLHTFVGSLARLASKFNGEVGVTLGKAQDAFEKPFRVSTQALENTGWMPKGDFDQEILSTLNFYKRKAIAA